MTQLALIPGNPARDRFPPEPITRSADISDGCRWWLRRVWGDEPLVGWVMLNPSLASDNRDDPTMRQVIGRSYRLGFGGCVVVNLVPFITPSPPAMRRWLKSGSQTVAEAMARNRLESIGALKDCSALVAAWGAEADMDLAYSFAEAIDAAMGDQDWLCLGQTAAGTPKHPLARGRHRVPHDFKPVRWKP